MQESNFIRGIWGIYDIDRTLGRWYSRRKKIDNDITLAILNPYAPKCKVYIFGEENFKIMTDKGFDTVLIDKKPFIWDMEKEQYRHKIEIWKAGLSEAKEVVFLDWDCIPLAPVQSNFWELLRGGEKIKSTIFQYKLRRVFFRHGDERKVSSSTFVYIRDIETCNGIIETWERIGRPWQEEIALSKYIDEMNGGWKGNIDYMNKFEPPFHTLYFAYPSSYVRDIMQKYNIFFHLNCHRVSNLLGEGKKEQVKINLDNFYNIKKHSLEKVYQLRLKEEQKEKEQEK